MSRLVPADKLWTVLHASKPETALAHQIALAGLPAPKREFLFAASLGRLWRADFAFPDQLVLVEVQGGVFRAGRHVKGKGYTADCEKLSHASALGWRVLYATPAQVQSGEALLWLEVALGIKSSAALLRAKAPSRRKATRARPAGRREAQK